VDDRIALIRKNAELVVERLGTLSGIAFGYDRESVKWVEGFIERQRSQPEFDLAELSGLVSTLGSFLGECIIKNAGGTWSWSDQDVEWGIRFGGGESAFPISKVRKQFVNGVEGGDSILGFFDVAVRNLATGEIARIIRASDE
jgi:hypothetical protein